MSQFAAITVCSLLRLCTKPLELSTNARVETGKTFSWSQSATKRFMVLDSVDIAFQEIRECTLRQLCADG